MDDLRSVAMEYQRSLTENLDQFYVVVTSFSGSSQMLLLSTNVAFANHMLVPQSRPGGLWAVSQEDE